MYWAQPRVLGRKTAQPSVEDCSSGSCPTYRRSNGRAAVPRCAGYPPAKGGGGDGGIAPP